MTISPPRAQDSAATSQANAKVAPPLKAAPDAEPAAELPPPFQNQKSVSYSNLLEALRVEAQLLEKEDTIAAEHQALLKSFHLSENELSLESYSRVRLLFEATRDGGLWGLRWDITDQMPWSDRIWSQWEQINWKEGQKQNDMFTATAECDELSALFALLARDIGVDGFVGLHWPTWNHVVAVWEIKRADKSKARIVVPTSQVFLTPQASLGTREFKTGRIIFPYARHDIKEEAKLPVDLARYFIKQIRRYAALPQSDLQARRNLRGGS